MICQSCSDSAKQIIPSSSKEKGVFQKRWSSDLTTRHCCLSPHDDFGSASTRGRSSSAVLSRGSTHVTTGLSQLGGWRKHGASEHHTSCPTRLRACNRQATRQHSTDTTAHRHCGMHGEVGTIHAVHPSAWEKRQAVGGTGKRLLASQRKPASGDSKSRAQTLLQAPLQLLADTAPSSGKKLETARLQPLYGELELADELLQEEFTARR